MRNGQDRSACVIRSSPERLSTPAGHCSTIFYTGMRFGGALPFSPPRLQNAPPMLPWVCVEKERRGFSTAFSRACRLFRRHPLSILRLYSQNRRRSFCSAIRFLPYRQHPLLANLHRQDGHIIFQDLPAGPLLQVLQYLLDAVVQGQMPGGVQGLQKTVCTVHFLIG